MAVRFDVETVHRSVNAAAVIADAKKLEAASRAQAEAIKRVAKETGVAEGAVKKAAAAQLTAAERTAALVKRQEMLNRIMRETGASATTARKVIAAYGTTIGTSGQAAARTAAQLDKLEKETRQLTAAQQKSAGAMSFGTSIARGMVGQLAALTGGIFAATTAFRAIGGAVSTLTGLQDNLLGTQAVTNATANEMARLESEAKRLGATTPRTAVEIAGLQQELGRAGFSVQEITKATPGLIAFASAGKIWLEEATDVTATIVKAFDLQVEETSRVTDVLATASSSAKTNITQLSEGFKYLTTTAVGTNTSLEVASAALAVVQERGLKAGIGGRSLNEALIKLTVETPKAAKALKNLGLDFSDISLKQKTLIESVGALSKKNLDLESAIAIAGTRGGRALLNLTAGYENFVAIAKKNVEEAEGSTQRMADTMESGLGGATRELKSALEGLQIAFAQGLEPALLSSIEGLTTFAQENQDLISDLGSIIGVILKVAGAYAAVATEILSVLTLTKLVRGMAKDIQQFADESNAARDAIMSWQEALRSGDTNTIQGALGEAEKKAASLTEQIKKLEAEQAKFTEGPGSQRWTVVAKKIEPLRAQLNTVTVNVTKLKAALDTAAQSADGAAGASGRLTKALEPTNEQLEEAARLESQLRTRQEKLNDELEKARGLFKAGALATKTWTRALEKYNRETQELRTESYEKARERVVELRKQLEALQEVGSVDIRVSLDLDELNAQATQALINDIVGDPLALDQSGFDFIETFKDDIKDVIDSYDGIKKTHEEMNDLWHTSADLAQALGDAAVEAAERGQEGWARTLSFISDNIDRMIDGLFMLGDILSKAGKEDLGNIATGIGQIASGDYGAGIGSVAQGFGLTGGGVSQFGGAKHGNFIAEGAALGAQYGGVYGAIIGAFAGAFVKKGADDLHSGLEEVRGRADLIITEAQGELAEVGAQVEQVLEGFFNSVQDALTANLDFGGAGMEFHIREDRVRVVVNGIEKVFSTIEEALAFAAQGVLAFNATAEGLGDNMRSLFEHLSGPDVIGSLEQLQEAFNLAADLDFQETGVTGTYIKSRERALAIGREYGMNLEAILALEDKRIEADRRALEAQTASVFGVDDVVGRFTELTGSIKRFDAELAASEESRASRIEEIRAELEAFEAAAQEAVAGGEDAAGALLSMGEGGIRARDGAGAFRDDLDLTGSTFAEAAAQGKRTREEIEALKEELAALEKAAQESLEALGVDEIGKLWTTAVDQVAVSLIDMIQAIQGPTAKIEELEEIRHRQFLFTLYAQIQQAKLVLATMEGVSQAVRVMFEGLISDAETLFEGLASGDIKFPTAGAGGRGGKAQERKQAEEDAARAAEDFNTQVALMTRQLSGASSAEIAAADALAELAEKGAAAKMSAEEVAAAVGMLAELQLRDLAADWTQAAQDFGKVNLKLAFEDIRSRAEADLATALASAGDNPEAYQALRDAVRAGMTAEMRELGQGALSGGRFGVRQEARETAREIRFLMRHLEELGLTANQVAQNVKDAVVPELLGIIKTEAKRTGDLDAYNTALAQEAQLQRVLTRIRLEGLRLELQAANAITPAIATMFDTAQRLLDLPTVEGGGGAAGITPEQLAAISRQRAKERAAGGTAGTTPGGTTPTIETLADLIAAMQRDAQTPMQRLAAQFEEMMARIAAASGTAEERAQAAALAQDVYNKALADLQEQTTRGLRDLVAEAQQAVESRKAPVLQLSLARTAFEQARASLDLNNEASVQALEEAARKYLDIASSFTSMVGGGAVFDTAQEAVAQLVSLLPGMVGAPTTPTTGPTVPTPISIPSGSLTGTPSPTVLAGAPTGGFSSPAIEARLAAIEAALKGTRTDEERRWNEGAPVRRAWILAAGQVGR